MRGSGRSGQELANTVLETLRGAVLKKLLDGLAIGSSLICVLLAIQSRSPWSSDLWLLIGMTLGLVVQRIFHARLRFRLSAALFLIQSGAASTYLLTSGHFTPATALLQTMLVLSAALFFGRRASLWVLGFFISALILIGIAAVAGYARPSDPEYWNPTKPIVWIRYATVLATYGGSLALAFGYLIAGLESSIANAEEALLREQSERAHRELTQAALDKSQRAEALGQLAAGIAHDFNNSLTVILATSELMQMTPGVTSELSQLADDIHQVARTAANTARQLLTLGREGQQNPERISVAPFLGSLEKPLRHLLRANVTCTMKVCTTAEVFVDSTSIQQSVFNLAINARDAMPDGGAFEISAVDSEVGEPPPGWRAQSGRFVAISCRDTGTGIDESTLEHIFEPFFTTKAEGKGTGLGLAMVRKTAYDAGGYVLVESTLGMGTTIHFYLPLAAGA